MHPSIKLLEVDCVKRLLTYVLDNFKRSMTPTKPQHDAKCKNFCDRKRTLLSKKVLATVNQIRC